MNTKARKSQNRRRSREVMGKPPAQEPELGGRIGRLAGTILPGAPEPTRPAPSLAQPLVRSDLGAARMNVRSEILSAIAERAHLTGVRAGPEAEMIVEDVLRYITRPYVARWILELSEES